MIPAKEICLVSLEYKPYRGSGLTIYAEELARGLSELGHHVTVLAGQRPGLPVFHQVDGVDVYRAAIGRFNWFTYCWRAVKMLRNLQHKISFDVVHFLDVYFAYAYRGPFVASVWQSFRQALRACDGRPCHTGNVEGIDTSFFRPVAADALRHRLGLDGLRLILFVGFATPRKGLEYLAQAMTMLPDDVHLLIVGRWAPGCQERFRRAAGSAMDRVHEVGFVADSERPAYYSLADLYVSPSVLEGLGITPVEAMSCGTPAVVTSASSGPEEVGDAGLIVPPCDPEALALGIRRLLDDDRMRTELGRRGRQRHSG
jgi:glycosyltransferase involved in cell wall biosynthesis